MTIAVDLGRKATKPTKIITKQNNLRQRGAQIVPIGIPTICQYIFELNLLNILSKR